MTCRALPCLLVVALWATPAEPCTQISLVGETTPTPGGQLPTDGDFWFDFSGSEISFEAAMLGPGAREIPLPLECIDPDLMRVRLPRLNPNTQYTVRLDPHREVEPLRLVQFRSAAGPLAVPALAPQWTASFEIRRDDPCANAGLYVTVEASAVGLIRPVALRLFDAADMRPLGSVMSPEPGVPVSFTRWVGSSGFSCVRLAAVSANGQLTHSQQVLCHPPAVLDAGVMDAGPSLDSGTLDAQPPDSGDAGANRPDAEPDAGPDASADAGQAAPDAGPNSPAPGGSLEAGSGGCGCRAPEDVGEAPGWALLTLGVAGLGLGRRARRRSAGA